MQEQPGPPAAGGAATAAAAADPTRRERRHPISLHVYVLRTRAPELRSRETGVARLREELGRRSSSGSSGGEDAEDDGNEIDLARFETLEGEYEPEDLVKLSPEQLRALVDVVPAENEESPLEGQPDGRPGPAVRPPFSRVRMPLYVKQASNALKHYAALRRVAEGASDITPHVRTCHLIVEDDVLFDPRSLRRALRGALEGAPEAWEMLILGHAVTPPPSTAAATTTTTSEAESSTAGRPPEGGFCFERIDEFFARSGTRSFLACDSYAVTPRGAAKLLSGFLPIRFPTHMHMAWRVGGYARRLPAVAAAPDASSSSSDAATTATLPPYVDAYIVTPNMFLDGSKVGTHVSSLAVNNRLIWNRRYMALEPLLLPPTASPPASSSSSSRAPSSVFAAPPPPLSTPQAEAVEKILGTMAFRDHPDLQHLAAAFYARQGQHRAAAELLERARATHEAQRCAVNRDSRLLNDLCDVYRHLQDDLPRRP